MSNSPNQVQKKAIKRLMQDLQEIQDSPVENVSAAPLDSDMFEWHCNFQFDEAVYHLILFFPKNYPYESPSAEFVPKGYQFTGGATTVGKKGVKACLSIFSDFAMYHTEWAGEKGMGWSPGYTVQTVLLNLVSFLSETQDQYGGAGSSSYMNTITQSNAKLAKNYTCADCGHKHSKPFPPLESVGSAKKAGGSGKNNKVEESHQIVDYISKVKFDAKAKPKTKDDIYGYGLVVSGPTSRPSLTTPCEFLNGDSFYGMKKSMGKVQSMMKDELSVFLPMYLSENHGSQIKGEVEACLESLRTIIPNCKKASLSKMVIKTIPNLMSATVVEFSKGTQHTSENHLNGYFALHRLFLWCIETYPELQQEINDRLKDFIAGEENQTKKACPHIGEWLMLLSGSSEYTWQDVGKSYLTESWKRNVMWYVKDDAKLGYLDTEKNYRLSKTLAATAVSRKLLAFQILFLDIAMPPKWSREQIIERYDQTMGFPTPEMVKQMKEAVTKIDAMKGYSDWFKVLKLTPPSDDEIFDWLVKSVEYSINTDGYKWTFWKNQGGWAQVLKKYPNGTPGWKGTPKAAKGGASKGETEEKGKGKGKGKKSKEVPESKSPVVAKGKGRGKAAEPMEIDAPAAPTKGKGRGGKRKTEEPLEEEDISGKKGGRGGKKPKKEEEEAEPKGRGRGKGVRGGAGGGARGRGRGKRGK